MTQIEEMKQWLEVLENSVDLVIADAYNAEQLYGKYPSRQAKVNGLKLLADAHKQAITSLHQAIAEAKQEPVAWRHDLGEENGGWEYFEEASCPDCQPLYTQPQPKREWVGLTADQKLSLEIQGNKSDVLLAELVESWLREMNT